MLVQVVVPLSTIPNWQKEFAKWAPFLNTIVYVGDGYEPAALAFASAPQCCT